MTNLMRDVRRSIREEAAALDAAIRQLQMVFLARLRAVNDTLFARDACLCWRLGGLLIRLSPTWRPATTAGHPHGGA